MKISSSGRLLSKAEKGTEIMSGSTKKKQNNTANTDPPAMSSLSDNHYARRFRALPIYQQIKLDLAQTVSQGWRTRLEDLDKDLEQSELLTLKLDKNSNAGQSHSDSTAIEQAESDEDQNEQPNEPNETNKFGLELLDTNESTANTDGLKVSEDPFLIEDNQWGPDEMPTDLSKSSSLKEERIQNENLREDTLFLFGESTVPQITFTPAGINTIPHRMPEACLKVKTNLPMIMGQHHRYMKRILTRKHADLIDEDHSMMDNLVASPNMDGSNPLRISEQSRLNLMQSFSQQWREGTGWEEQEVRHDGLLLAGLHKNRNAGVSEAESASDYHIANSTVENPGKGEGNLESVNEQLKENDGYVLNPNSGAQANTGQESERSLTTGSLKLRTNIRSVSPDGNVFESELERNYEIPGFGSGNDASLDQCEEQEIWLDGRRGDKESGHCQPNLNLTTKIRVSRSSISRGKPQSVKSAPVLRGLQSVQSVQSLQGTQVDQGFRTVQSPTYVQELTTEQSLQNVPGVESQNAVPGSPDMRRLQSAESIQGLRTLQSPKNISNAKTNQSLQNVSGTHFPMGVQGQMDLRHMPSVQSPEDAQLQVVSGERQIVAVDSQPEGPYAHTTKLPPQENEKPPTFENGSKIPKSAMEQIRILKNLLRSLCEDLNEIQESVLSRDFAPCGQFMDHIRFVPALIEDLIPKLDYSPFEKDLRDAHESIKKILEEVEHQPSMIILRLVELGFYIYEIGCLLGEEILPPCFALTVHAIQSRVHRLSAGRVVRQIVYVPQSFDPIVATYYKDRRLGRVENFCSCKIRLLSPEHPRARYCPPDCRTLEVNFDPVRGKYIGFLDLLNRSLDPKRCSARVGATVMRRANGVEHDVPAYELLQLKNMEPRPRLIEIRAELCAGPKIDTKVNEVLFTSEVLTNSGAA
ncbi:unnamed protein product [Calicophoron daubneyi]|uniref:Uncharacterized protein n=1 Tax=Calicophoron daubneyi TaxID=300641 RepID=A0AAV2T8F8_CALDB